MALDSRNKRFGMIGLGSPVPRILPNPDGGFASAEDRLMLIFLYPSELAEEPVAPTSTVLTRSTPRRAVLGKPIFELWLTTDTGVRIAQLSTGLGFSGSKVANGIGQLWYTPPNSFNLNLLKPDRMVQVWYQPPGGAKFLFNVYFLRHFRYRSNSIEFGGPDQNILLTRRIVAAKTNSAEAKKSAMYADDMMKEVVAESLLDTADPTPDYGTRAWANFSVQSDSSQGPVISDSFPFHKLLTIDGGGALPMIAKVAKENGIEVFFYVAPHVLSKNGLTFQFRTKINFPGHDVSDRVTFDEDNLIEPELSLDYMDEANYIYATGQGEESERKVVQVWDETRIGQSIWGRIEAEADSRNLSNADDVEANAYTALWEGRPKIRFTGKPKDSEGLQFGDAWNFGDLVSAKFKFLQFTTIIRALTLSVNDMGEHSVDTRLDYES